LPFLKQLKSGDSFFIEGHYLTIENRWAQFQFFGRISNGWELRFKWQSVARPDPSFTGWINDRDRWITVQLGFENPVWTIERLLGNRSHHWFDEFGEKSFHCGGSDKSTGQQSERPGDFHKGLISARQFSIFVQ
jgi:hypothetical protein